MQYAIYAVATISLLLSIGGFEASRTTGRKVFAVHSCVTVVCAIAAMLTISWWPLVAGFITGHILQAMTR